MAEKSKEAPSPMEPQKAAPNPQPKQAAAIPEHQHTPYLATVGITPQHVAKAQAAGFNPGDLVQLIGILLPAILDWLGKRRQGG